ncbi:hypothetical protein CHUAL_007797 [Chamberlinius hualienensis]
MSQSVSFEDVLDYVGSRGRWQMFMFVITSMSGFFGSFHHLGSMFLAATPDHWCAVTDASNQSNWGANWTDERVKQYTIPVESNGDYNQCRMYAKNYSAVFQLPWSEQLVNETYTTSTADCSSWNYDHSNFDMTVVSQWDLVCDRAPLAATVQATYMVGVFFGTFTYAIISDRFGRRCSALIAVVEFIVGGILAAIPIHYVWFIIFRMLTGMGTGGAFSVTFVLMAECISPRLRDVSGIGYQIPFGLGYMVLPLIAYFIRTWYWLQLTIGLSNLFLLSYFWLLPNSPRWLTLHNRCDEASTILLKAAKFNRKKDVKDNDLNRMLDACYQSDLESRKEKVKQPSTWSILLDLFRTPQMRKRILVSYFTWASVSLCYYGLAFKAPTIGSQVYMIAFLSSLTEIPSYIIGCVIVRYLSRRLYVILSFLLGGIFCLLILAVPEDNQAAVTSLAISGKFFINIAYAIMYLYATEIFPTGNRNVALGTSSMCARVGSTIAPYIVQLMGGNSPLILFGIAAVLAGLLCILLPETKDRHLPQTVHDVEKAESENDMLMIATTSNTEINT